MSTTTRTTPYGDAGSDTPPTVTAAPAPDETKRRIGKVVGYALLTLFALLYLFPFVIQVGTSFKTDPDATASPLNPIPSVFTTQAYRELFQQDFGLWFVNSVIVSVVLSLPTTGPMLLGALKTQDVNLAATFLLFVAALTVIGMLISDLALAALDPRIRFGATSEK